VKKDTLLFVCTNSSPQSSPPAGSNFSPPKSSDRVGKVLFFPVLAPSEELAASWAIKFLVPYPPGSPPFLLSSKVAFFGKP